MQHSYNFSFALSPSPCDQDGVALSPRWAEDESPDACEALTTRTRETVERLKQTFVDLQPVQVETEEVVDIVGNILDPEVSIRRLHRFARLAGTWEYGRILLCLYDKLIEVDLTVDLTVDAERLKGNVPQESLARLIADLESATRFSFRDDFGHPVEGSISAASLLMARHGKGLSSLRRAAWRSRWLRALGVPSMILLTVAAAAVMFFIVRGAVEYGSLQVRTNPTAETTFVTTSLSPPALGFGITTDYSLEGWIQDSHEQVRLPVSRDIYLRASPGARYTVLRTSDPTTPLVLRSTFSTDEAVLRIGDHGVAWFALTALLPALLWFVLVLHPWLRGHREGRAETNEQMTRNLLAMIKLTLLLGVVAAIRRLA